MVKVLIGYSIALILLGVIGYFASGMVSLTALIPAFFGLVMLLIGLLAKNPSRRKIFMHVAVVLGFLALLGSFRGVGGFFTLMSGGEVERPAAVISQTVMAVLSLIFVIMCVKSFIDARKSQGAQTRD